MAKLVLKNICKTYSNGFKAIEDFNLEIEDGEFIVFVGPSGCGKSTVLRMIAGLENITAGDLFMDGKVINYLAPKDRNMAMVFQNYALYPHMNVFQNMSFSLGLRRMKKQEIDEKVKEIAKLLGLSNILDRKPNQLSGGQKQRVALGRALVRNPKIFLFDEPLSNLDAKLRTELRNEIILLHRKIGTTFIYVTHDQVEAMTMADRIVVLKDGEVQQVDSPANIYAHPKNKFVAEFIGNPSMNFIKAKLRESPSLILSAGSIEIEMEEKRTELSGYIGKELIIGIRPEDIYLSESGEEFAIIRQEMLGSQSFLYLSNPGNKDLIVEVDPDFKPSASHLKITFAKEKLHLFDQETEIRIIV